MKIKYLDNYMTGKSKKRTHSAVDLHIAGGYIASRLQLQIYPQK